MTPAIVEDAYPPNPFVTIHSVSISAAARASRSAGSSRRRTILSTSRLGMRRSEENGTLRGKPPTIVDRLEGRSPPAAVFRRIRREDRLPCSSGWWRDQRLRERVGVESAAEIHHKQSIVAIVSTETKHEGRFGNDGPVERARRARSNHRIVATNAKQIAMEIQCFAVRRALGPIELASGERLPVGRIIHGIRPIRRTETRELRHKIATSGANDLGEIRMVIGEIQERARRGKLLALKKHRRLRQQQQQRGECSIPTRTRLLVEPAAVAAVCYLIMILREQHELRRR